MLLLTYLLLSHGCLIKGKIALFGCSLMTIHIYRAFHLDTGILYSIMGFMVKISKELLV